MRNPDQQHFWWRDWALGGIYFFFFTLRRGWISSFWSTYIISPLVNEDLVGFVFCVFLVDICLAHDFYFFLFWTMIFQLVYIYYSDHCLLCSFLAYPY